MDSQMDPKLSLLSQEVLGTLQHKVPSMEQHKHRKRYHDLRKAAQLASVSAVHGEPRSTYILLHSLVFAAVIIPCLIFYSGGEPVLTDWTLSLFVITYRFYCTVSYSTQLTPLGKMFVALSYLALLASCVGSLVSRVLGMVFIYVDSILAAGLFCNVLAGHREDNGSEKAAYFAVVMAPLGKYHRQSQKGVSFALAILAMIYAVVLFLGFPEVYYNHDALDVAMNLFGAAALLLCAQTMCVLAWLNGAVLSTDSSALVLALFYAEIMLFAVSYIFAGKLVAVTVLWLCVLASAAYAGYYLRVHVPYEELMIMRNDIQAHSTDANAYEDLRTEIV